MKSAEKVRFCILSFFVPTPLQRPLLCEEKGKRALLVFADDVVSPLFLVGARFLPADKKLS